MKKKIIAQALKEVFWMKIWVSIICLIGIVIGLLPPLFIGKLIDVLTTPSGIDVQEAMKLGIILITLTILSFFVNWYQNFQWFKMTFRGILKVREVILTHLLKNNYDFFEKNDSGDILQKAIDDTAMYAQTLTIGMPMLILNVSNLIILFVILTSLNIPLTIFCVISCVVYFYIYKYLNKSIAKNTLRQSEARSVILSSLKQILDGIEIIKLFCKEEMFTKKYHKTIQDYTTQTVKLQFFKSFGQSVAGFIRLSMPIGVLLLGVGLVAYGHTTVGVIIAFYTYMPYFIEPINNLCDFSMARNGAKGVEERIFSLIPESNNKKGLNKIDDIKIIKFENFNFAYDDSETIINDFNLTIKKGDRIAITGESGSGKSTLIKLLLGQLCPNNQQVKINFFSGDIANHRSIFGQRSRRYCETPS